MSIPSGAGRPGSASPHALLVPGADCARRPAWLRLDVVEEQRFQSGALAQILVPKH